MFEPSLRLFFLLSSGAFGGGGGGGGAEAAVGRDRSGVTGRSLSWRGRELAARGPLGEGGVAEQRPWFSQSTAATSSGSCASPGRPEQAMRWKRKWPAGKAPALRGTFDPPQRNEKAADTQVVQTLCDEDGRSPPLPPSPR